MFDFLDDNFDIMEEAIRGLLGHVYSPAETKEMPEVIKATFAELKKDYISAKNS